MPYKRKRDGRWLGQVIQHGIKDTSPISFATKTEAKDWEAEQRKSKSAQVSMACGDAADKYIDWCSLKFVERTIKAKKEIFKRFFESIPPSQNIAALAQASLLEHLSAVATERSGFVANTHRTHLLAWWNWTQKIHGISGANPFIKVEKFPSRKMEKHVPSMEDFIKVLDHAEGQDKILLLAYLHTAARRCELFKMTWADVDFGGRRVKLWTNKTHGQGARADWIDLTEDLAEALAEWRKENPNAIPVFHHRGIPYTTRHSWLPGLCKEAGVHPFHYHAIRHLTATYLIHHGQPITTVSSILRHRSLAVTEVYIRNLKPQREALKILPFGKKANNKPTEEKNTEEV